jgi:hypothetical protein
MGGERDITARCVQLNATPSQFYHSNVAHLNATGNIDQSSNLSIECNVSDQISCWK